MMSGNSTSNGSIYLLNEVSRVKSSINNSTTFRVDKRINFNVNELINESHEKMVYVGEIIEEKAKEMLYIYDFNRETKNFYSYLMREIMRNVVEHSGAKEFAVLLYSNDFREFGFKVIDNGIGIRKSLSTNPLYNISDDLTALAFCVRPGITRSYKRDPLRDDVWQNSGFGLHMVSYIVSNIGVFEIVSGNRKLIIKNGFKEFINSKIKGTEVTVTINTNVKIDIKNVIKEASLMGSEIAKNSPQFSELATIKTASKASILLE